MDTIQVSLEFNKELGMEKVQDFIKNVNSLRSPNEYTFCDVLEISRTGNIIIKISYPRYFQGNNAYLISSRKECFEVQKYFSEKIMEDEYWKQYIGKLTLSRVDIPFTYYMRDEEYFNSYKNIFKICAIVYNELKQKARPKGFNDLIDGRYETLIYSDNSQSNKSSNNKLMIYNQYLNLSNKLDEEVFEEVLEVHEDLQYRIRMEVSKRIRRKDFNSKEFSEFDILGFYFEDYKKYILEYALNIDKINELYDRWSDELAQILIRKRALGNFNYEVFVLQNLDSIYDYEILKRALKIGIENESTRENAVTKVRKVLRGIQNEKNIIVMDTYAVLLKMRESLCQHRLID